ncbi:MAG: NTP transferase domain-containing protein [Planctomycetes bacterium]|nr:NTP transferase domain-containing protein [Planctomycetota bacterium]
MVLGPTHRESLESWLGSSGREGWTVVEQPEPRGTGDAVRCALEAMPEEGDVLILCGDTPLLEPETMQFLAQQKGGAMLSAWVEDPTGYGRVERSEDEALQGIVEQADCSEEQAEIQEVNAGVYVLDLAKLKQALAQLKTDNAQGEFYLTDAVVDILRADDGVVVTLEGDQEMLGVNTLSELSRAGWLLRDRIQAEHMAAGVLIDDPVTTFIEDGVSIGPGTRIHPFSVIRHGCQIGSHCSVGPFAHLRGETVLEDGAELGNFVEAKNTQMGEGAKAKHLTYLGDAVVGARANIGCGTITANYDGKAKHPTRIGERAFIGSGTVLVAPVNVGEGATTGAGSVVLSSRDVPADSTVVGVPAAPLPPKKN